MLPANRIPDIALDGFLGAKKKARNRYSGFPPSLLTHWIYFYVPFPLSFTTCGLPPPSSLRVRLAVNPVPTAVGANCTVMVQEEVPPAGTGAVQVFPVIVNKLALLPVIVGALVKFRAFAVLLLVIFSGRGFGVPP